MRGRPTKFKQENVEQVEKLALLGLTNEQMAAFFEVALSTFQLWRDEHEDFSVAVKNGKEVADAKVAASLFNRAIGCSVKETKVFNVEGSLETIDIQKNLPPDPACITLWLKNRQPEYWRDKQEVQHSGKVDSDTTVEYVTKQELTKQDKDDTGYIES